MYLTSLRVLFIAAVAASAVIADQITVVLYGKDVKAIGTGPIDKRGVYYDFCVIG
jgi:hypothetical protein